MPVPCARCKRPMSERAVVCPHCRARQADRDPLHAGAKRRAAEVDPYRGRPADRPPSPAPSPAPLSGEEARALTEVALTARGVTAGAPIDPVSLFRAARPAEGAARWAHAALTALASPVLGVASLAFLVQPRLRSWLDGGEWERATACVLIGAPGVLGLLALSPLDGRIAWLVTGVASLALVARAALRDRG